MLFSRSYALCVSHSLSPALSRCMQFFFVYFAIFIPFLEFSLFISSGRRERKRNSFKYVVHTLYWFSLSSGAMHSHFSRAPSLSLSFSLLRVCRFSHIKIFSIWLLCLFASSSLAALISSRKISIGAFRVTNQKRQ